jgi:hypothetical protein
MTTRNREAETVSQILLAALVVVACVAGIPPIVDTVVKSLAQLKGDSARAAFACGSCGVVQNVREVTLGGPKYGVSTVSGEGFAMLFALLKGKLGTGSMKIYEVEVRLQDGSVRVIREGTPPAWHPGDHVKVVMGRIKPVSAT